MTTRLYGSRLCTSFLEPRLEHWSDTNDFDTKKNIASLLTVNKGTMREEKSMPGSPGNFGTFRP